MSQESDNNSTWIRFESKNGDSVDAAGDNKASIGTSGGVVMTDDVKISLETVPEEDSESSSSAAMDMVATIEPSTSVQVTRDPLTDPKSILRSERRSQTPVSNTSISGDISSIDIINGEVMIKTGDTHRKSTPPKRVVINDVKSTSGSSRSSPGLQTVVLSSTAGGSEYINIWDASSSSQTTTGQPKNNNSGGDGSSSSTSVNRVERPTTLVTNNRSNSNNFKNGDIIVNLLPLNTSCAWIIPATFKPELVPEELMASSLSLTVEDYVSGLRILINDYRFTSYMIFYKRIVFFWISLGFLLLMGLLFSGVRGLPLFSGGLLWLIMNAFGIFICIYIKFRLQRMLESCVGSVNSLFFKHNLLLGVDDRGHLSCHKVNLFFIYFDTSHCIKYLNTMIVDYDNFNSRINNSTNDSSADTRNHPVLDITAIDLDDEDVIITNSAGVNSNLSTSGTSYSCRRISQKEKRAEKLILRYSQRWVKEFVRKRLDLNVPLHYELPGADGNPATFNSSVPIPARHCTTARCLCQYIEEHLKFKPLTRFSFKELCF